MEEIDKLEGQCKKFAEACYDENSCHELINALVGDDVDETDCKEWNITAAEWKAAILAALKDRNDEVC